MKLIAFSTMSACIQILPVRIPRLRNRKGIFGAIELSMFATHSPREAAMINTRHPNFFTNWGANIPKSKENKYLTKLVYCVQNKTQLLKPMFG